MAIFEIRPTTEIAIVGCIGNGINHDWLGMVMRDAPDQSWYCRYRFRYYDGGELGDPDAPDTKQCYETRPGDRTPDRLVKTVREMLTTLKNSGFGDDVEIHEIYGGGEKFNQVIASSHSKFFHSWKFQDYDGRPRGPSKFNV